MDSIYPFFKWANDTWLSKAINDSKWLFPAIEGIHIVALALLFGVVIVLNLRLLGLVMRTRPLAQLERELAPWTFCSLFFILTTGVLLFVSEAVKSFHSTVFFIKMGLLASAIIFHYAVSQRLMQNEPRSLHPLFRKAAAVAGIVLWTSVGFAGRAIAFF